MIYEGKIGDHPVNQYFYKDRWVVLVDPKNNNVITLYKIDLGDDEVSDLFASKILQRINEDKKVLEDVRKEYEQTINSYKDIIEQYKNDIEHYKRLINIAESNVKTFETLTKTSNSDVLKAQKQLNDDIETLIARRQF